MGTNLGSRSREPADPGDYTRVITSQAPVTGTSMSRRYGQMEPINGPKRVYGDQSRQPISGAGRSRRLHASDHQPGTGYRHFHESSIRTDGTDQRSQTRLWGPI